MLVAWRMLLLQDDWFDEINYTHTHSLTIIRRRPLAGRVRSVVSRWPRLTARLQTSAGERLLSHRIWSTHLLRGRPGRRLHWLLGVRPSDRSTWQLSASCAGTSSCNLATWPKKKSCGDIILTLKMTADRWTQSRRFEWTGVIWFAGAASDILYGMPRELWNRHWKESKFRLRTVVRIALRPINVGFCDQWKTPILPHVTKCQHNWRCETNTSVNVWTRVIVGRQDTGSLHFLT